MEFKKLLGSRIRALRKANGLTQEQLAERSEIHYSYIGGVERGDRNISVDTLEKLLIALDIPAYELFRFDSSLTSQQQARRAALDEHMTLLSNRSKDDIEMLSDINRGILKAIDSKRQ
ncbi:helix-turn-helix domain-containing protein [Paenibacillus agricola]|uniref:Helix-turn-helix transcriptional regulator n=1 Tax=Paenibacillus agricola TaxID=2716264 RepID=A0ABX0J3Y6_9BACL|nr:helix-turn-helix transcriptional regulator [Paenibacillus agricola]NHN28545.1 helix-turn-helix transcriptional regulator [Paenibacillus agricola]